MDGVYHPTGDAATPVRVRGVPPTVGPLELPPGEVHVWLAFADDPCPSAPLSADELARAERYKHPPARTQFVRCRGLLRALLGGYLGRDPAAVRFAVTADGKPQLADAPGEPHFNVSHTDGLIAVAVAGVPVGVDVEHARPVDTADGLVQRFFAAEERRQYAELPAELRAGGFLRGWACKEAILKGVGCGARGLDRCVVDLDPRRPAAVVALGGPAAAAGPAWGLACWQPGPGLTAAVAVRGEAALELR